MENSENNPPSLLSRGRVKLLGVGPPREANSDSTGRGVKSREEFSRSKDALQGRVCIVMRLGTVVQICQNAKDAHLFSEAATQYILS